MGYIGSKPATNFETVRKQVSTTNSGTTITLDYSVSSVQDILVTVNAVVQSYDNYSVSGTTLTLGGTLNNDRVEILYVGRTFQTVTPAVGTVTNEMLSGSIANSKLANSSITLNGSSVSLGGSATTPSGAMTFLSSTDLSSGVTEFIDRDFFTTYSSYKHFILDVQLICPSSNSNLKFIFQDGAGDVGTHQAEWKGQRNNAADEDGGTNGGSSINLFSGSASNNGDGINMIIELWQPIGSSNGDINMMWRATGGQAQQAYFLFQTGGGTSESGNSATGFVIKRASGNLTTSGNYSYVKIYGVQST